MIGGVGDNRHEQVVSSFPSASHRTPIRGRNPSSAAATDRRQLTTYYFHCWLCSLQGRMSYSSEGTSPRTTIRGRNPGKSGQSRMWPYYLQLVYDRRRKCLDGYGRLVHVPRPQALHFLRTGKQVVQLPLGIHSSIFQDDNVVGPSECCPPMGDGEYGPTAAPRGSARSRRRGRSTDRRR